MGVQQTLAGFIVLTILSTSASAADQQRISLKEAVARGLDQNNQARAAHFQAEAARSGATAASLHYLPSITLEESWTRSNLPVNTFMMKLNQGRFSNNDFIINNLNNPSPISDFRSSVTMEQPLLVPAAWASQRAATRSAERQEALSEQTRQQIAFHIFSSYLEVQKARAHQLAAQKALDEASESRRQALIRIKAGLGLKSDELRADTHLAAMEQQAISAANNLTLARMQLALAIGGKPGDEMEAADPVQLKAPQQQLEQLLQLAYQKRQDLRAAEHGKQLADSALLQARSAYLPTVGAFGSWQMNDQQTLLGHDHDSWTAGISLRWNVFDGFRTWHTSSQASASRTAAAEMLEQTRKDVSYQVHEAWLRRIEAEKRLQVARTAVAAAEEATRILAKRFENALATMLELLDAQSALHQARANLIESENYLVLATGRVYFAAGQFLKEVQQ